MDGIQPNQFLRNTRPDTRHHVKDQEALRPPDILQHASEHIHTEHIEKHVRKRMGIMHEHISHKLERIEILHTRKVQSE